MRNKQSLRQGYTLIEILVAISIIAILTVIGVTNFRVANQKARDGKRKGDLEQIRAALELYRTDEKDYPDWDVIGSGTIESAGGTVYMNEIPDDPVTGITYYYTSGGDTYSLCAALELETTGTCSAAGADCGDSACNYQIDSPF